MDFGNLLKGVFERVANAATGGIAGDVMDLVEGFLPQDLPPEQKADLQLKLKTLEIERQAAVERAAGEAERNLTERISMYEGTARDLMAIPLFGPIMLFLRGVQRPLWGFGAMYADFQVFSGGWSVTLSRSLVEAGQVIDSWTPEGAALVFVNILVLGFLFGERAIKNLLPMVAEFMGRNKGAA